MNDFEPVDLSALDPAREPERWARLVKATRLRIETALARRATDATDLVYTWSRLLLPAAAVLAIAFGAASAALGGRRTALDDASEARRLAVLSEHSIGRGERPSGAQISVALRSRRSP